MKNDLLYPIQWLVNRGLHWCLLLLSLSAIGQIPIEIRLLTRVDIQVKEIDDFSTTATFPQDAVETTHYILFTYTPDDLPLAIEEYRAKKDTVLPKAKNLLQYNAQNKIATLDMGKDEAIVNFTYTNDLLQVMEAKANYGSFKRDFLYNENSQLHRINLYRNEVDRPMKTTTFLYDFLGNIKKVSATNDTILLTYDNKEYLFDKVVVYTNVLPYLGLDALFLTNYKPANNIVCYETDLTVVDIAYTYNKDNYSASYYPITAKAVVKAKGNKEEYIIKEYTYTFTYDIKLNPLYGGSPSNCTF